MNKRNAIAQSPTTSSHQSSYPQSTVMTHVSEDASKYRFSVHHKIKSRLLFTLNLRNDQQTSFFDPSTHISPFLIITHRLLSSIFDPSFSLCDNLKSSESIDPSTHLSQVGNGLRSKWRNMTRLFSAEHVKKYTHGILLEIDCLWPCSLFYFYTFSKFLKNQKRYI